jgi:cytochrome c oxidase cbb3-type subunit I/II
MIPIYVAGITQGLMWRAFDANGVLAYGDFVETVMRLMPFYWARVLGGVLYFTGGAMCLVNLFMTWRGRPATYETPVQRAPALAPGYADPPQEQSDLVNVTAWARRLDVFRKFQWHRNWERLPLKFTVWTTIAIAVASLFEIIPTFVIKSNVATIDTVRPYTPLEVAGRDVYVAEGCYNCHSQMIRPIFAETERYGDFSLGGEFVYDRPFQWGSRRIGPDLQRVGGKYSNGWHMRHLLAPKDVTRGSIMPVYEHLLDEQISFDAIPARLRALTRLGVGYTDAEVEQGAALARAQAQAVIDEIVAQDGADAVEPGWETTKAAALVAYLQRLGTDLYATPEAKEVARATD